MKEEDALNYGQGSAHSESLWPIPTFFKTEGGTCSKRKIKTPPIRLPLLLHQSSVVPRQLTWVARAEPKRTGRVQALHRAHCNSAHYRSEVPNHAQPAIHPLQGASNRKLSTPYQFHSFDPPRTFGDITLFTQGGASARPAWVPLVRKGPQLSPSSPWCPSSDSIGTNDHFILPGESLQRNDLVPSIAVVVPKVTCTPPIPFTISSRADDIRSRKSDLTALPLAPPPIQLTNKGHLALASDMDVLDVSRLQAIVSSKARFD